MDGITDSMDMSLNKLRHRGRQNHMDRSMLCRRALVNVISQEHSWQGCRASSSVWREDLGLLSRSGRKRRPSSRDDGGISWVSSGCGALGGFLNQGSQVSMRMARGSVSLLSSHGKRLRPQEALKKDSRGLSRVAAGNPGFPLFVSVTSGNF